MKRILILTITALGFGSAAFAQFAATGTTTVSVTVAAESAIQVNTASTALTSSSIFGAYTGTTSLTYKVRTSPTTGTGAITRQVTSDFGGTGGPSVGTPPTAGDALTYTCTVSSPGTACSGTRTALTSGTTSVATFGADNHSTAAGNSASVAWSLTNDPVYKVGAYSATVTFTISAT